MSNELAHLMKYLNHKGRVAVLRHACYLLLRQKLCNLPTPVHFALMAVLCMFILLPIMPLLPLAIPIVIGGGLAGGLLLIGGSYGRPRILSKGNDR
jgi:hypothetical protein